MTTLTAPNSITLTLNSGDSVRIQGAGGNEGQLTVTPNGQAFNAQGTSLTPQLSRLGPPTTDKTIGPFPMGATVVLKATIGSLDYVVNNGIVQLQGDYTLASSDEGKQFACTTALNINVPDALVPRPTVFVDAPPTGNVSIVRSGSAALINGASTTLTRSRSSNPAGFVILAHQDADSYGVSGS